MIDSENLKTQTSYSLKLHDVRKAAAAYELMHSAAAMLQMLPVPVLEALRDSIGILFPPPRGWRHGV
jgi:hypothetical protein